ncbi:MAG: hypothetical protein KDD47_06655 [Acidobacteria bacterium]|nr:hypothetical protein [Acidobacteriota bacterium]
MSQKNSLRAACAVLLLAFASGLGAQTPPPVMPGDLLGSTGAQGGSLVSIDSMTGAGMTRFPLGSLGPVTEIRFRSDGVLFGSTGGGASNFLTIDPDTGTEALVGMHAFGAVTAMEFVGSTLYGAFFDAGGGGEGGGSTFLVEIDQTDGSLTNVGQIAGYDPVRGLAYDSTTGTMYGVGIPLSAGGEQPEGIFDDLITINLATGAPTTVGPTGGFEIGGMTFGPDGLLYGGVARPSAGEGATVPLVILNTATGAATVVGDTGLPALSGLTFVPGGGGGGTVTVAIPTASQLGLLLLGALLAASAFLALRRRQPTATR